MNLVQLTRSDQLEALISVSSDPSVAAVVVFKHSVNCSSSSMAWARLERGWSEALDAVPVYFLDLIAYRQLSEQVAAHFGVRHESPQVLLIRNGKCIYHSSHSGISVVDIELVLRK